MEDTGNMATKEKNAYSGLVHIHMDIDHSTLQQHYDPSANWLVSFPDYENMTLQITLKNQGNAEDGENKGYE